MPVESGFTSVLASMAASRRQEGSQMFLSARKLPTPALWSLLELKEGSHETGLSGLHMALNQLVIVTSALFWGGDQEVSLLREM